MPFLGPYARARRFTLGVPRLSTVGPDGTRVVFAARQRHGLVACPWEYDVASGTDPTTAPIRSGTPWPAPLGHTSPRGPRFGRGRLAGPRSDSRPHPAPPRLAGGRHHSVTAETLDHHGTRTWVY